MVDDDDLCRYVKSSAWGDKASRRQRRCAVMNASGSDGGGVAEVFDDLEELVDVVGHEDCVGAFGGDADEG